MLKDQLSQELKKRELYLNKSARVNKNDLSDIKSILEKNACNVSRLDQSPVCGWLMG